MSDLEMLRDEMREFTRERGWEPFHDPKSLALALMGEVGELAELLQWLPADDAAAMLREEEPRHQRVAEELSDVLIYLVRLADVVGVDLGTAVFEKLAAARARFPAEAVYEVAPEKGV